MYEREINEYTHTKSLPIVAELIWFFFFLLLSISPPTNLVNTNRTQLSKFNCDSLLCFVRIICFYSISFGAAYCYSPSPLIQRISVSHGVLSPHRSLSVARGNIRRRHPARLCATAAGKALSWWGMTAPTRSTDSAQMARFTHSETHRGSSKWGKREINRMRGAPKPKVTATQRDSRKSYNELLDIQPNTPSVVPDQCK